MSHWLNSLPPGKRNIYAVLLGIILLTIPCYCLGIAALAAAPPVEVPTPTPFSFTATPIQNQDIPSLVPDTATPTETPPQTDNTATATLEPTPTQLFPTVPATDTPTAIPATATPTNTPLPSDTPTGTPPPTNTPTATVDATATAAANATATAAANRPPEANDDNATTTQGTSVVINVFANDVDPNGNLNPASVTIVNAPNNGTATVGSDGRVTFTPNPNFAGTAAFTYQICDTLGACDTATVTVSVTASNQGPVANDDSATTPQDSPITINVANNDTDPNGNLGLDTVAVLSSPANGSASAAGGGQITYTPNTGFVGTDTFTYQICDTDGACDTATVNVNVTVVNQPPVANDENVSTLQDTAITINVLANDNDPDGNLDPSTVTITNNPGNGTTSIEGDNQVIYTPNAGFTGNDAFSYQVCDTDNACDTATVTVSVSP